MHRELLAQPHIASFSAFLLGAFVSGYLLARYNANKAGIPRRHIDNQALLAVALGLIGARFFSWLFYFPEGTNFWKAMVMGGGGLVFYGGVIFVLAGLILYTAVCRIPLKGFAELWAAPLAVGLAVGRVGCFMAGCCWGDVCAVEEQLQTVSTSSMARQIHTLPFFSSANFPLAVQFPPGTGAFEQHQELGLIGGTAKASLPVHPAQLYEAIAVLSLAFMLQRRYQTGRGSVFALLCVGYGVIRFLIEFLRADSPPIYLGLTLSQCISIAFVAIGILLIWQQKVAAISAMTGRISVQS